MRKKSVLGLFLLSVLSGVACKGNNPAGSSPIDQPPINAVLTIVSARTSQPVSGAILSLPSGDLQSQADGTVTVSGVSRGVTAVVRDPDFLEARFKVEGDLRVRLWPADGTLPEDFTQKAVYGVGDGGIHPLYRPNSTNATVLIESKIWNSSLGRQAVIDGISSINNADGDMVWTAVEDTGSTPAGFYVRIYVDPAIPGAGTWITIYGSGIISDSRIAFHSLTAFPGLHFTRAMAHELGHARGLEHTPDYLGMMWGADAIIKFSSMEREVMRYMFLRPPGTRWQDDSTGLASSSSKRTVRVCAMDSNGNSID